MARDSFKIILEKVKPNKPGYFEIMNDSGIEKELERRGELWLDKSNELVKEQYPNMGFEAPIYVGGITQTRKKGTNEYIVVPNEKIKNGKGEVFGARAQAEHSILTHAMDAGRG